MPNKKNKANAQGGIKTPNPNLDLLNTNQGRKQGSPTLSPLKDLKSMSNTSRASSNPILFGKPSRDSSSRASSGSALNSLLSNVGSQSVSKLLGGGLLSFGMSSLFSSISDLFGGTKSAPPPLQKFSLPGSQQATLYSTSSGVSATNLETGFSGRGTNGVYTASGDSTNQAAIVKAVKNALLTSSSLNDVIGEL